MHPGSPTSVRRLAVLDYGLFDVNGKRIIGIQGYYLETSNGARVLVDTGFPAKYARDPERAGLEDGLGIFGRVVSLTLENLPEVQLAKLGLKPPDITHLILTHGDVDHLGGLHGFPRATLILGEAERALPRPRYFGGLRPVAWPEQDTRLIGEDTQLFPGLTLLATPGHSPGHLSLLVRLKDTGPVLLTADAISRPGEFLEGFGGAWDEPRARSSALRLMALAEAEGAWVIYGHDPAQWPTLKKAPEVYT